MKNLIEFVIGEKMKYYHLKMLKKLPEFGLMFIELGREKEATGELASYLTRKIYGAELGATSALPG